MGYTGDPRESSAPILLGLGYAVSINMGDSGKLGAEDSTLDFIISAISYDWTFKHFKLIVQHSINHCLTREYHRRKMIREFNVKWDKWVCNFLQGVHQDTIPRQPKKLDIFSRTSNWIWSEEDSQALDIFETIR